MNVLLALILVAPVTEAPDVRTSLRLPHSAQDLVLEYRQIEDDLAAFVQPAGLSGHELQKLRVQALLVQQAAFSCDVEFRNDETRFGPGRRPLGFTVDPGGVVRFFLVDGRDAVPIVSEPVETDERSPRLVMNLEYVDRAEARITWRLGDRAGTIVLKLGAA